MTRYTIERALALRRLAQCQEALQKAEAALLESAIERGASESDLDWLRKMFADRAARAARKTLIKLTEKDEK